LPLNDDLSEKLVIPLGKPTYNTVGEWVAKFNKARVEDDFFIVTGRGEAIYNRGSFQTNVRLVLSAKYEPKPGTGGSVEDIGKNGSLLNSIIESVAKNNKFIYFLVYPDCIDLFRKARELAAEKYGIAAGWSPVGADQPVQFNVSGGEGGTKATPQ